MRLYFGRIAPTKPQQQQVAGGGWAWRYKVRIFDKHPPDKNVLPDENLPWAQVLMPVTAGSGAANYAQTPSLNQGDTVSIAYYDEDEQQPIITGVLPRTESVSTSEPVDTGKTGYTPSTGFTENKPQNSKTPSDESNENNVNSQPSNRPDQLAAAVGSSAALADTCDPNAYKTTAVATEINNLLNEIGKFSDQASRVESMIAGTIDRVHALVNPYVGEMFFNLYEALVPVLNAGLSALYKKVYSIVLASTGSPIKAKLAAEAALIALIPPIQALQEAIQLLANAVVTGMLSKVEDLIRDTIENNDQFTSCAGTQFNGALVNSIINDIDDGIGPLIAAVSAILSGGFATADAIRSSLDIIRDFAGGLLGKNQGGNKCGGLVKEYVIGVGPKKDVGDILSNVLAQANMANAAVNSAIGVIDSVGGIVDSTNSLTRQFGDFPFLSEFSEANSPLKECSTEPPKTCYAPEVFIFGGRGEGAKATAYVGRYVDSDDGRTVTNKRGGVVSIKVDDGGSGYVYPPFVEIRDNCNLGIGGVARSVIKNGKVIKIYIVTPGEGYPSAGQELFVVDDVEVISGGSGYVPGIVQDQYGGEYEVIVDDGRVVTILPINIIQVPDIPVIKIPRISPEIPPGGILNNGKIYDASGAFFADAVIGNGLTFKPVLVPLPTAEQIASGDVSDNITPRLLQTEVVQVIDCVED
ncbi:hypothetical protein CC030809_00011 [Synechococcus phage S-CAM7]|uniref:Baseplate hub + tail lysozyme n=1 Tax=Synechococcus phage S-CAM7 TaxID=1883368 RepID=A0A7D5JLZ8_9CAUD|nr:hypothetical protein CC030809_00011 [Synechococcus phage S-CAM7]